MTTEASPLDQNRCRLCFTDDGELCPIFGSESSNLAQKIYDCTRIEIKLIEGVPSAVCEVCKSKLIICSQFIAECWRTDRQIQQLYARCFEAHTKAEQESVPPAENEEIEIIEFVTCNEDGLLAKSDGTTVLNNEEQADEILEVIKMVPLEQSTTELDEVDDDAVTLKIVEEDTKQSAGETVFIITSADQPRKPTNKTRSSAVVKSETKLRSNSKPKEQQKQTQTKSPKKQENRASKKECTICGIPQQNMKQHMAVHTGVKKHVCEYCNKAFAQRGNLNIHIRIHTGSKPLKCDECNMSFGDPSALKLHKIRHTNENKYHCNICDSTFKYQHSLQSHIRSHNNDRRHACSHCGKAFVTSSVLKKHIRQHTGERPYPCDKCSKAFTCSGNLTVHQRTHSKGKS